MKFDTENISPKLRKLIFEFYEKDKKLKETIKGLNIIVDDIEKDFDYVYYNSPIIFCLLDLINDHQIEALDAFKIVSILFFRYDDLIRTKVTLNRACEISKQEIHNEDFLEILLDMKYNFKNISKERMDKFFGIHLNGEESNFLNKENLKEAIDKIFEI